MNVISSFQKIKTTMKLRKLSIINHCLNVIKFKWFFSQPQKEAKRDMMQFLLAVKNLYKKPRLSAVSLQK